MNDYLTPGPGKKEFEVKRFDVKIITGREYLSLRPEKLNVMNRLKKF